MSDPELAALLTVLDLVLAKYRDKPERQHAFLIHFRECVDSRTASSAAAVYRARNPRPRKLTPPILPPPLHSRADTEKHNMDRIVAKLEHARAGTEKHDADTLRDFAREVDEQVRDTPVVEPPGIDRPVVEGSVRDRKHPGRER